MELYRIKGSRNLKSNKRNKERISFNNFNKDPVGKKEHFRGLNEGAIINDLYNPVKRNNVVKERVPFKGRGESSIAYKKKDNFKTLKELQEEQLKGEQEQFVINDEAKIYNRYIPDFLFEAPKLGPKKSRNLKNRIVDPEFLQSQKKLENNF